MIVGVSKFVLNDSIPRFISIPLSSEASNSFMTDSFHHLTFLDSLMEITLKAHENSCAIGSISWETES